MNQDLLSGGSSSRRSRGPGGPAVRGNASSTARAPQQAAEEGDDDEHMNRVVEEEGQLQQRPEASQVDGERGQPWAPSESGASNGPRGDEEGEDDEEAPPNEVNGGEKGARWMWGAQQRRLRGQPLGEEEEEEEEEENNNHSSHQEEEEAEERTQEGEEQGREEEEREEGEEEEEDEDEEEMDQDSDDFEHSAESGREEEEDEEAEVEEGLRSPSLRNNTSAPNNNLDSGCTHQSSSNKKQSLMGILHVVAAAVCISAVAFSVFCYSCATMDTLPDSHILCLNTVQLPLFPITTFCRDQYLKAV